MHDTQVATAHSERNSPLIAGIKADSLKAFQRTQWGAWNPVVRQIKLHNFFGFHLPSVYDVDGEAHRTVGGYVRIINLEVAIGEGGVAQSVAERIQRLAIEVTVRAFGHGVVFEGRKLIYRF